MHIGDIFRQKHPVASFEFFPPKTPDGFQELSQNIQSFVNLSPSYISVTYGAGGNNRQFTHKLVLDLQEKTGLTIIPHLTCIGHNEKEIAEILENYCSHGIENIMALRGDPPKNESPQTLAEYQSKQSFRYAHQLVRFIKKNFPQLGIGIAGFPEGHPETPNRLKEMDYLKAKIDEGADYLCTQLFFNNADFYDFRERCALIGIKIPIVAGIMPITSYKNMNRIAELALGARFPARMLKALKRTETDEDAQRVGIHWSTEQVRDLLDHDVAGLHFYTLNKSNATKTIYQTLGIKKFENLTA